MYKPKRIEISRSRTEGKALCQTCGGPKEWTRERARQHADEKRHVVHFVISDITTYQPTEKSDA